MRATTYHEFGDLALKENEQPNQNETERTMTRVLVWVMVYGLKIDALPIPTPSKSYNGLRMDRTIEYRIYMNPQKLNRSG